MPGRSHSPASLHDLTGLPGIRRLICSGLPLSLVFFLPLASGSAQSGSRNFDDVENATVTVEEGPSVESQTSYLEVRYDRMTDLVSVRARNATLQALLNKVAQRANVGIDIREEVALGYRVSASIGGVPLEYALQKLLQEFNAAFVYSATLSETNDSTVPRLLRVVVLSKKAIQARESSEARQQPTPEGKANGSREHPRLDPRELLRRIVEGKREDVKSIVDTLREAGRDEERERLVEALIQRLGDGFFPTPDGVIAALRLLAPDRAADALARLLQEADPRVRANAAASLGRLQDQLAVEPLSLALSAPDAGTRQAAATSLALIGGPQAMRALIDAYIAADSNMKYPIWLAIVSHGDARSQSALARLIDAGHRPVEPTAQDIGARSQATVPGR